MRQPVIVRPSRASQRVMISECLRAVRGSWQYLRKGHLSQPLVREYFESRTVGVSNFDDVVAVGSAPYDQLLQYTLTSISHRRSSVDTVLDFGCGAGHLLNVLRRTFPGASYVGVDVNTRMINQLSATHGDQKTNFEPNLDRVSEVDVAFLINVLCYVSDLELVDLLADLSQRMAPASSLIVIEPFPSVRWEQRFSGLSLRLRRPDELAGKLQMHGYEQLYTSEVGLATVRSRSVLRFAWAAEYRREGNDGSTNE